jgi:hypothetical protein
MHPRKQPMAMSEGGMPEEKLLGEVVITAVA